MKTLSISGNLRLVERGGYWYAEGANQATNEDRTAILKDVSAKLEAISPEAIDLARALACIMATKTGDVVAAKERIKKENEQ